MIQKVLQYHVTPPGMDPNFGTEPTIADIEDAIQAAKDYDCVVELTWSVGYSENYSMFVYKNDSLESVYYDRIKRTYSRNEV